MESLLSLITFVAIMGLLVAVPEPGKVVVAKASASGQRVAQAA